MLPRSCSVGLMRWYPAEPITAQMGVMLWNEHTVFPISTLLVTGTISSLALLGSLANLHCRERSNTLLWNLKKKIVHEDTRNHPMLPWDRFRDWQQSKVQTLSKRIPHGLTRTHSTWFNNGQVVIQKRITNKHSAHQKKLQFVEVTDKILKCMFLEDSNWIHTEA